MIRPFLATAALSAAVGACTFEAPRAPVVHRISMLGSQYSPSKVDARVGDTLRFVNDDTETHAVFVPTRGFARDLGKQRPAETREILLLVAGRFTVECVPHADMNLVVQVR